MVCVCVSQKIVFCLNSGDWMLETSYSEPMHLQRVSDVAYGHQEGGNISSLIIQMLQLSLENSDWNWPLRKTNMVIVPSHLCTNTLDQLWETSNQTAEAVVLSQTPPYKNLMKSYEPSLWKKFFVILFQGVHKL